MKITKSNKKESAVRSSIKNSFTSIANNKFFRVMFVLILIGFLVYQSLVSFDYYMKGKTICNNTLESVYDTGLIKVSLIDDEGTAYIINGNKYKEGEYEYVPVISGNEFWFSEEKGILVASLEWSQSKTIYYSYLLISAICWVTIMISLVILKSMFTQVLKSKACSVLTLVVLMSVIIFDLLTMYSVGDLLANWSWYSTVCKYVPIIVSSIKILSLIKYFNSTKISKKTS